MNESATSSITTVTSSTPTSNEYPSCKNNDITPLKRKPTSEKADNALLNAFTEKRKKQCAYISWSVFNILVVIAMIITTIMFGLIPYIVGSTILITSLITLLIINHIDQKIENKLRLILKQTELDANQFIQQIKNALTQSSEEGNSPILIQLAQLDDFYRNSNPIYRLYSHLLNLTNTNKNIATIYLKRQLKLLSPDEINRIAETVFKPSPSSKFMQTDEKKVYIKTILAQLILSEYKNIGKKNKSFIAAYLLGNNRHNEKVLIPSILNGIITLERDTLHEKSAKLNSTITSRFKNIDLGDVIDGIHKNFDATQRKVNYEFEGVVDQTTNGRIAKIKAFCQTHSISEANQIKLSLIISEGKLGQALQDPSKYNYNFYTLTFNHKPEDAGETFKIKYDTDNQMITINIVRKDYIKSIDLQDDRGTKILVQEQNSHMRTQTIITWSPITQLITVENLEKSIQIIGVNQPPYIKVPLEVYHS